MTALNHSFYLKKLSPSEDLLDWKGTYFIMSSQKSMIIFVEGVGVILWYKLTFLNLLFKIESLLSLKSVLFGICIFHHISRSMYLIDTLLLRKTKGSKAFFSYLVKCWKQIFIDMIMIRALDINIFESFWESRYT